MQHIEQAGVHSGDSACSLPPYDLTDEVQDRLREQTKSMALELKVLGLMNVQFAIQHKDGEDLIFVLEVNPRASRTVPFVSKAIGVPLAKVAARCMAGESLKEQGVTTEVIPPYFSVKEAVFPFVKFPGVDPLLGPEMKSTGEVMGVGHSFGEAFAKSQLAAGGPLPQSGRAFISVRDGDKNAIVPVAQQLSAAGFELVATSGTAEVIESASVECKRINKVNEGRPHIVDQIKNGDIDLIINTTEGKLAISDSFSIRREALNHKVTYFTTVAGAQAVAYALPKLGEREVNRLQDLHREIKDSMKGGE